MRLLLVLVGMIAVLPLSSAVADSLAGPIQGKVVRVIDGDTLEFLAHVWLGLDVTTHVRIRGIDTPEAQAKCAQEKSMAAQATKQLKDLTINGVTIANVSDDKYFGRVIADVITLRQGCRVRDDRQRVGPALRRWRASALVRAGRQALTSDELRAGADARTIDASVIRQQPQARQEAARRAPGRPIQTLEVSMKGINVITMILLIIGGINWAILGVSGLNLVASVFAFAPVLTTLLYILVGVAALYQIMPLSKQLQAGTA